MSDTIDKVIESLPDVWFDWYARLLPGSLGVVAFAYASGKLNAIPAAGETFSILMLGYLVGHLLQPMVGFLTKPVERWHGKEEIYKRAKQDKNSNQESLKKVSKAHAEANSMLACAIVLAFNSFWFWKINPVPTLPWWFAGIGLYCIAAWVERTFARARKIMDLDVPASAAPAQKP